MLRVQPAKPPTSRVWLTPDLSLGFHHFNYLDTEYDGLAHRHGEYCVVAALSGAIEIVYSDRCEIVREGELMVVNPGDLHCCRFGTQTASSQGLSLIVRRSVLHSTLDDMGFARIDGAAHIRFSGKHTLPEALPLIRSLIAEFETQQRGYGVMVEMILRQLLIYMLRCWPPECITLQRLELLPQLPWLQMHRATEYMNSHGKHAFRLTDLCAEVGVSTSRFIPLFKNSSGASPHSYYNSLLIFKARKLLQVEGASTKEAAYALGFRNVSHFCALFHQLAGTTPQAANAEFDVFGGPNRPVRP